MIREEEYIGQPVKSLQQMLRRISFRDESIPRLAATGEYDDRTVRAVNAYQQTRGLPVTGETDEQTWNHIAREFRNVKRSEEVIQPPLFGDWRLAVEPGLYHPLMYLVQAMFKALHDIFPEVPDVDVNGKNDEKTTRAIKWLQNHTGRENDGVMDKFVWELINGLYYLFLTRNDDYLPKPYSDASFAKEG